MSPAAPFVLGSKVKLREPFGRWLDSAPNSGKNKVGDDGHTGAKEGCVSRAGEADHRSGSRRTPHRPVSEHHRCGRASAGNSVPRRSCSLNRAATIEARGRDLANLAATRPQRIGADRRLPPSKATTLSKIPEGSDKGRWRLFDGERTVSYTATPSGVAPLIRLGLLAPSQDGSDRYAATELGLTVWADYCSRFRADDPSLPLATIGRR